MKPESSIPPPPITYRIMQAMMCPVLKTLGMCCRSAFCLCSEQMDRELTKGESIRLRAHLMMCGLCRRIPAQFDGLRSLVQACEHQDSHEEVSEASMTPEAKQRISEQIQSQTHQT